MTSLIVFIRRARHLSSAAFSDYWQNRHAPLIRACPEFARHLVSYTQYHQLDCGASVAAMFGVTGDYDGVAVLTFRDAAAMQQAFAEPQYLAKVRPDEPQFVDLDSCLSFIAEGNSIL